MKRIFQPSAHWLHLLLIAATLGSHPLFAGSEDKTEPTAKDTITLTIAYTSYFNLEAEEEDRTLYFYDQDDNMVYTTVLAAGEAPSSELYNYLYKSEYLTQYAQASYFRLKE